MWLEEFWKICAPLGKTSLKCVCTALHTLGMLLGVSEAVIFAEF
jgi:hypothetical protein